jgi:hypothetical protein
MAKKTFISYKFSESQATRDVIIEALGDDAEFYMGETSESPDLKDLKAEAIKEVLKDMIHGTSVTIVVVSPEMIQSNWIDWELKYSLRETERSDRVSRRNGIVGVIQKVNGGYDWLTSTNYCIHSRSSNAQHNNTKMHTVIHKNRFNQKPLRYICGYCKTISRLSGSYISLIPEEDFLTSPIYYIDNAWDKSQHLDSYEELRIDV